MVLLMKSLNPFFIPLKSTKNKKCKMKELINQKKDLNLVFIRMNEHIIINRKVNDLL